jgi:hypothetical protein
MRRLSTSDHRTLARTGSTKTVDRVLRCRPLSSIVSFYDTIQRLQPCPRLGVNQTACRQGARSGRTWGSSSGWPSRLTFGRLGPERPRAGRAGRGDASGCGPKCGRGTTGRREGGAESDGAGTVWSLFTRELREPAPLRRVRGAYRRRLTLGLGLLAPFRDRSGPEASERRRFSGRLTVELSALTRFRGRLTRALDDPGTDRDAPTRRYGLPDPRSGRGGSGLGCSAPR